MARPVIMAGQIPYQRCMDWFNFFKMRGVNARLNIPFDDNSVIVYGNIDPTDYINYDDCMSCGQLLLYMNNRIPTHYRHQWLPGLGHHYFITSKQIENAEDSDYQPA